MYTKKYEVNMAAPQYIFERYNMNEMIFFDIETTGFDKERDKLILISLGHYVDDRVFEIKQYFAESFEDEERLLSALSEDLHEYDRWCSYNGIAFDEPFIKSRMKINNIEIRLPEVHVDLYRLIKPYYKKLGLARCNLKTVEKYIGIKREDKIDGGMSVELYYDYLTTGDDDIKQVILLHNYEDVLNLPKIFNVVYKIQSSPEITREDSITDKQLRYLKFIIKKNNVTINANISEISKRAASKVIDSILKGKTDEDYLKNIINNSY